MMISMRPSCLLLALLVMVVSGCSSGLGNYSVRQEPETSPPAVLRAPSKTFGIIYPMAYPAYENLTTIAGEYAARHNVKLVIKAPDTPSIEQQIRIVDTMIKDQVDGIAISPVDSDALTPVINKAVEAGIPVVCFESDAPGSRRHAFVGADNYAAGQQIAISVSRLLDNKGMILVENGMSSTLGINQRLQGLMDYLTRKTEIEVLEVQFHEGIEEKAMSDIEQMIDKHPHFDAIVGLDFISGTAGTLIWKAKGLNRDAVYLGLTPITKEAMQDGHVTSLISQNEDLWGEYLIEALIGASEGEHLPSFMDAGIVEIFPE
ncbi:sugar ABC transporter substrate-binding protein [Paenibacillus sambharensis]|uniref:Sugar ABC transporter substrate-binding protein n=1 Tax=Paenibacillus sambharensis TaxID=1803190 RepID=A0A2W1L234_9BACL|nr:substrate-binding domain-containing protein [Paenibacillus sambharensis]PZD94018.1 sugar ABC transporter substrate-binding protein [Paenibacillus sambharensis]